MWDPGVEHHGSFGPRRSLLREAVAAIPAAGGAVASLLAVGVGVVVAAVLDVARTDGVNDKKNQPTYLCKSTRVKLFVMFQDEKFVNSCKICCISSKKKN